jgi:hypothetical protein
LTNELNRQRFERIFMKLRLHLALATIAISFLASAVAQNAPGVLSAADLKKLVPATYFFRGQSAPVQLRNAVGFRDKNDRFVLASLVDTSGYSTDIQEKYQGLFITEVKLKIGEAFLAPGSYGFGFKDGKFLILDVAADEILSVPFKTDDSIAHPVPLKLMVEGTGYRLYAGKKWVGLSE